MRILGVIDLRGGIAVHARGGDRQTYEPVQPSNGDALALARRYLDAGITDLYVADLDAIERRIPHKAFVRELSRFGAPIWLDAGVSTVESARDCIESGASRVIVGLETLTSFDALRAICEDAGRERVAFSLDLRDGAPVGLLGTDAVDITQQAVASGAGAVIVLDLARVGTGTGVDLELPTRIRAAIPDVLLMAGGGIRDAHDLAALRDAGCDGALVGTAFHEGRLSVSR